MTSSPRLWAIADLHLASAPNRRALPLLKSRPDDWLIVAGDVGETEDHLRFALDVLADKFARLIWVPGNHDLWTLPTDGLRGEAKYRSLVKICRERGVLTPEDPYPLWPDRSAGPEAPGARALRLVPLFLLYDYSLTPSPMTADDALRWAEETGIRCADEDLLHFPPHDSRQDWCAKRLRDTRSRLDAELGPDEGTVLISHWPLRSDFFLPARIERFAIWCGSRETHDWHRRYRAEVVVYGHLHIKRTHWHDGVRFEEVSLGYPAHWDQTKGIDAYLRPILPLNQPHSTTREPRS